MPVLEVYCFHASRLTDGCCFVWCRNPATLGLCSKCYREAQKEEGEARKKQRKESLDRVVPLDGMDGAAITSSVGHGPRMSSRDLCGQKSVRDSSIAVEEENCINNNGTEHCIDANGTEVRGDGVQPPKEAAGEGDQPEQKNRSRCFSCNKKVGLLGFECRCGYVYCSNHRHAMDHACTFDYATFDREKLAKANPVVAPSKLDRV